MTTDLDARLHAIFDGCHNAGPTSEERICRAEEILGVSFPLSFRAFLFHFGASWFRAPYSICGIADELPDQTPEWTSVVLTNQQRRKRGHPPALIYISSDGVGCSICLDTTVVSVDGEAPVVAYGPGIDVARVAHSFIQFAEKTVLCDPIPNKEG